MGICWNPREDIFQFKLEDNFNDVKATKRNILSRLFDPLSLLCPIVTKAKMLLQELWILKLDWDESIPLRLDTSWQAFKVNLRQLHTLSVPRFVQTDSEASLQIHGFSDSSMRAYGCCIYVRSQGPEGVKVTLLAAKSKVAPLKTKSLPRLELCAAHLLAKLWAGVSKMLSRKIDKVVFWSDSEITLHWVKTHPSTLSVFVGNRVAEIQEWSQDVIWKHVPTKQNPADIVSRGCNVEELSNSIWFNGPEFLLKDDSNWPQNSHITLSPEEELLEKRAKSSVFVNTADTQESLIECIEKYSSYNKLLRIFAYVMRFVQRIKRTNEGFTGPLTVKELRLAFLKLVEIVQNTEYKIEKASLKENKPLSPHLQKFNPFVH